MKRILVVLLMLVLPLTCFAIGTNWQTVIYDNDTKEILAPDYGFTNKPANLSTNNQFMGGTNSFEGHIGIGTNVPLNQLYLYGRDSTPDDDNRMDNGVTVDGVPDGDKGYDIWESGIPKWSDYIYRNEEGEFRYWYNYESRKDVLVMSRNGRMGINKPTNILNPRSYFEGTGTNDMSVSGVYTYRNQRIYRIVIDGIATPNTFKAAYATTLDRYGNGTFSTIITGVTLVAGIATNIEDGVKIQFSASTGHSLSDQWTFIAFSQLPPGTLSIHPPLFEAVLMKTNLSQESYIDRTFEANSTEIGNLMPVRTGTNNALYIGTTWPCDSLAFNVITNAVGAVLAFEYWNGTVWYRLSSITNSLSDDSLNFSRSGVCTWEKMTMTDWAKSNLTVGAYTNEYYWMRIYSTNNVTTAPVIASITRHSGMRMAIYDATLDVNPVVKIDLGGNIWLKDYQLTESLVQSFYWKIHVAQYEQTTATVASVKIPFTNELMDAYGKFDNIGSKWTPGVIEYHRIHWSIQAREAVNAGRGFYVTLVENENLTAAGTRDIGYVVSGQNTEVPICQGTYVFIPSSVTNVYSLYSRRWSATDVPLAGGNTNWWYGEKLR